MQGTKEISDLAGGGSASVEKKHYASPSLKIYGSVSELTTKPGSHADGHNRKKN